MATFLNRNGGVCVCIHHVQSLQFAMICTLLTMYTVNNLPKAQVSSLSFSFACLAESACTPVAIPSTQSPNCHNLSSNMTDNTLNESYQIATEMNPEKLINYYDEWVINGGYEKDVLNDHQYTGPQAAAAHVTKVIQKKDARILDIGAGTGLIGETLAKEGFTNLVAVDPSATSLQICKERNWYKEHIESFVGPKPLPYADNSFDGAVSSGVFMEGHCDGTSLKDVLRLVKPGGKIVIATKKVSFYDERTNNTTLHEVSEDLIAKKVCSLEIKEYPGYVDGKPGVILTYTPL